MEHQKKEKQNIRVLIAPLDWGLGHATRCVPLIRMLISKGLQVIVAAEGAHEKLLRIEFPQLLFVHLPGYRIKYARRLLMWRLVAQLPKLQKAIQQEHQWLRDCVVQHQIHWVISDNRYGLWHPNVPCVMITHQLRVKLPAIFKWAETLVQQQLYSHINQFSACWVPDLPLLSNGLSGFLGHPAKMPKAPVHYLGWLSRFRLPENQPRPPKFTYKCLIMLSGPEPQRTLLENRLLPQLQHIGLPIMLVRGLPNELSELHLPENITVKNHLPAAEMQEAMLNSNWIIARCGYSTLMDAFSLQKKCIFLPTPGQTEQEYLAQQLKSRKMALVYEQNKFNIEQALAEAAVFNFQLPALPANFLFEMEVDRFLNQYF